MSRIFIHGAGAVSPAGWGVTALREALAKPELIQTEELPRPGGAPLPVRRVPAPSPRPAFLTHPRLRRSSPVSQFCVAAALEALGDDAAGVSAGELTLGLVCTVMNGGVRYSRRFYEETLRDPVTASPLIFPETVFNAPASHLAAVLGSPGPSYTLVGDQSGFAQGIVVAAEWLVNSPDLDACLVVATEEADWLTAAALELFRRKAPPAEGAGALLLKRTPASVELIAVTDAFPYLARRSRHEAVTALRAQLPAGTADDCLLFADSLPGAGRWADWPGERFDVVSVLGEGFAASGAWACAAAVDLLKSRAKGRAICPVLGANHQAMGAAFARSQR